MGDRYWYITDAGEVARSQWDNYRSSDIPRREFLGVFKNESLAEGRLKEVKKILGIK